MALCCFFGESEQLTSTQQASASRPERSHTATRRYPAVPAPSQATPPTAPTESTFEVRRISHASNGKAASSEFQGPRTPPSSDHKAAGRLADHDTRDAGEASNSNSSSGTFSSRAYSTDSSNSRPQPVEELHDLIATRASLGHNQEKSSAGRNSRRFCKGGAYKDKLGSPIKQQKETAVPSFQDPDPLQGNPDFRVLKALVPGASSSVYLCQDLRDQSKVAIKLVSRGVSNAKAAEREISNLRLCGLHPYIIHMREVFLTSSHLALVFDYAPGGNLANYIQTFQSSKPGRGLSEERSKNIFLQIVVAVDFCHKMGIANRDIKLENVLLVPAGDDLSQAPDVKLGDFGFSKDELADSICKTACGTPEFVAPEILSGEMYDGKSSDIWSMGVLLFAMLTGTFPFSRPSDDTLHATLALRKLFTRIAKAQYPRPGHLSKGALDLLEKMLQSDPGRRIDVAGILQHPWFDSSSKTMALEINNGLLAMPDAMLTGFARQSDEDIAKILQASARRSSCQHSIYQTR